MKLKSRHAWTLAASLGVLVAIAAVLLVAAAGAAGSGDKTYTITTVKTSGSVWIAGGGKAMNPGWLNPGKPSPGDQRDPS